MNVTLVTVVGMICLTCLGLALIGAKIDDEEDDDE